MRAGLLPEAKIETMPARKPIEAKRRIGRRPGLDAAGRPLPEPVVVLPAAIDAPTPPVPLGETGRIAWAQLWQHVPWLSPQADTRMIARLCQMYDRHAVLVARVDQDDVVSHGIKGQPRAHPLLATLSMLEKEIRLLEQQAGLTPASRAVMGWVEVRRVSQLDEMTRRRRG
jgi:P27 family predicted phage terminase small subunit